MKVPPEIIDYLKEKDNFLIATHISPEADALGSSLALSMVLESLGKKTVVYDRDAVPDFYVFLPGSERFTQQLPERQEEFALVLLDCNTPERAGIKNAHFRYSAVIDHHATGAGFGDVSWIRPDAAATGMMIFSLIRELGASLTREMAVNLYAAIAIDTGTFRFGNTTAEVLKVAAELAEAGAKPGFIANNLYESWSTPRFRLLVMTLNTLDIRDGVGFIHVSREMFLQSGAVADDTENFPGFPRMMRDIDVAAFFRQTGDDEWKVSLRSKGLMDVSEIAASFGGGGHVNAAGYTFKGDIESAKAAVLQKIAVLK